MVSFSATQGRRRAIDLPVLAMAVNRDCFTRISTRVPFHASFSPAATRVSFSCVCSYIRFLLLCVVLRCCHENDAQSIFDLEEINLTAFSELHRKPLVFVDGHPVGRSVCMYDISVFLALSRG